MEAVPLNGEVGRLSFFIDSGKLLCIVLRMNSILEEVAAQVREVKGEIRRLTKFGFKTIIPRCSSTPYIMVNNEKNVVVKRSFLCGDMPNFAIPTIKIDEFQEVEQIFKDASYGQENFLSILVQPLADISYDASVRALNTIEQKLKSAGTRSQDLVIRNVGMLGGEAVIFDW